jgi:uncharacterized membrane-anchored protein
VKIRVLAVIALAGLFPVAAEAQGAGVNWVKGPKTVALGNDIAELALGDQYAFAGAQDTRRLLREMGNTVDDTELGLVNPLAQDEDWMVVFEYNADGYVKDDDADEIDKDAILESYQKGTEAANEQRKSRGIPGLHVTGWFEEPHYDKATHNLVWALHAKSDDGSEVVNYNMRLLGREGFMSVTLVDEPSKLAVSKPKVEALLRGFRYKTGKSYAEWVPGDKVAQYGLVALVAGGAGAAAVKTGLLAGLMKVLAKGGKAVILLIVAAGAGLKKLLSGRTETA